MTPPIVLCVVGPPIERSLRRALAEHVGREVAPTGAWLPDLALPLGACDPRRHQVESTALMRAVLEQVPPDAARVLAVTDADLFIPALTFVFGRAQLGGRLALVSLARLRPEFHGAPPDPARLLERAQKEAVHELGHLLGLAHCGLATCAMAFSVNVAGIDAKDARLCPRCAAAARSPADVAPPPAARRVRNPLLRGVPWRS